MKDKSPTDHVEIYKRHRPKTTGGLVGQPEAVKLLDKWFKNKSIPHAVILTGPSGCGKTSIARIIKTELGCNEDEGVDYFEINASDSRGIETIRRIKDESGFVGMGKNHVRVYLLDECHKLTSDAQNAMLKWLEDTPKHVYVILATTDPAKVLKTIHSRCTEVRLKPLSEADLKRLVLRVAKKEGIQVHKKVVRKLVELAEGGARKALVGLEVLRGVESIKEQLRTIERNDSKTPAIAIARALLDSRATWQTVAKVLKENMDEDAEGLRRMILGYCSAILLNGKPDQRAAAIIDVFRDNVYDSGKAGLVAGCFEVINSNRK